jgi:hypothetical protein
LTLRAAQVRGSLMPPLGVANARPAARHCGQLTLAQQLPPRCDHQARTRALAEAPRPRPPQAWSHGLHTSASASQAAAVDGNVSGLLAELDKIVSSDQVGSWWPSGRRGTQA